MSTAAQSAGEPAAQASRPVDLAHYPRRRLFECFRNHPLPVFSISTAIDISGYATAIESRRLRFYTTLCCLIGKALNDSAWFRHRIVDDVLVEFPIIKPSINVALEDESFSFADAEYNGCFQEDYASIRGAIAAAQAQPNQDYRGGLDDRFFLTHLPWLSFTGIQHPYIPAYGHLDKSKFQTIEAFSRLLSGLVSSREPWDREASGTNSKESPSSRTKSQFSGDWLIRSHGNHSVHFLKGVTRRSARAMQGARGLIL